MRRVVILVVMLGLIVAAASARTILATPATGVVRIVLARGTLGPFHSQSKDFTVDAKKAADVVVVQVTIAVGGYVGWHTHPGPAFGLVKSGHLAVTRAHGSHGCTTQVYGPGQALVEDPDMTHFGRNAGSDPVVIIATYTNVPVGGAAATSVAAPANCR